jgi:NADPH:quinone reductase-like Zn-dependent oxidoreductase
MKALRIHAPGSSNDLVYEDAPLPVLGPTDVLIEVHATAITFHEFQWPETYVNAEGKDRTPSIPAHEFSGVVAAIGSEVTRFVLGDEVFGIPGFDRDGAAAEYVAAEETSIAHRPLSLSHHEAATVPLAALTALQALTTQAGTLPGEHVLVLGATGGVGSYAVQIAKNLQAIVTGVIRSIHDGFAESLGAHRIVQTGTGKLQAALQEADVVIDTVGGTALREAATMMHDGARLITLGAPVEKALTEGRNIEALFFIVTPDGRQLSTIADMIDANQVSPTVAAAYPLAEGRRAYNEGPRLGRPGRVVLTIRE